MAKIKPHKKTEIVRGDKHVRFADGRCEIYHNWVGNEDRHFMEITDDLDKTIGRRRFLPFTKTLPIQDTLETREEDGVPGIDFDDVEVETDGT